MKRSAAMKKINFHPISYKKERDLMNDLSVQIIDSIDSDILPSFVDVIELCRLALRAANHGVKDDDYRHVLEIVFESLQENKVDDSIILIDKILNGRIND